MIRSLRYRPVAAILGAVVATLLSVSTAFAGGGSIPWPRFLI
jgi:hypothetical protein